MNLKDQMLSEFEQEMARTRKVLSEIPDDKLDWKAAENLRTIGWNANHLADIPSWAPSIVDLTEFDMAPPDGPAHETPAHATAAEILSLFDKNVAEAKEAIARLNEDSLDHPWSLKTAGEIMFTIGKGECLRTWVFNHSVHHRAILSLYLRMSGVELTPVYDQ